MNENNGDVKKQVAREFEQINESPERLKKLLESFSEQRLKVAFQKERQEMLMKRRSAKKLSPEKTARAVRRYVKASTNLEQVDNAIDYITTRLVQLESPQTQDG